MSEPTFVTSETRGRRVVLWLDNPPVNALGHGLRAALLAALETADGDADVDGIVLAGRGRAFIAGADIREFGQPPQDPWLPDLLTRLEALATPVVAAMHGVALGGGLETALACHYRVAGPAARLGLPEVSLGLMPGAGGTQRLPRLLGLDAALTMMTSGRPKNAVAARELGLVDALATGPSAEDAVTEALALLSRHAGDPPPRLSERTLDATLENEALIAGWQERVAKKHPGEAAPVAIVRAVAATLEGDYAAGEARERALFAELMDGPQSAALRHLFFAERLSAKVPGLEAKARPLGRIGVVGGGTMGSGIAIAALNAGLPVTLLERDRGALEAGVLRVKNGLEAGVTRGKLSAQDMTLRLGKLRATVDDEALADADLIVEAVFEEMAVKRQVFARLERVAKAGAVLASNTSYLDLDALAAGTGRPGDVVGLHFFSPAHVMRLLEIVRGAATEDDVLATALAFAKKLRKVPIVAGVCPGFIGNRLYRVYQREAGRALLAGATPEAVDAALEAFGMKMGPLAVSDLSGLDIGYAARREAAPGTVDLDAFRVHDLLVEAGDKGRKTGAGFYVYADGKKTGPNARLPAFLEQAAADAGVTPRTLSAEEIVERCVYGLVNEGARALAEGIAQRASDIDVAYVNGYGFPRHRGGPMHHAEAVGLRAVVERIEAFGWEPAARLVASAEEGRWT
ncbi:MAG: 3-hydroxyacyl-CoA dehydrogenase NAD-binding domain-containing protein [Myxococcota bacterium]